MKNQILTSLCVLVILFLFKIIFNKLIKNNKQNIDGKNIYTNNLVNNNASNNASNTCNKGNSNSNCVYRNDSVDPNNSFDLKNINNILVDLKNIIKDDPNNNENKRIVVDKNDYVFSKESGNEEFHYKDLHNKEISARLNVSDEKSLLLNNVDCTNDTSCIIQPSIYNFHKY